MAIPAREERIYAGRAFLPPADESIVAGDLVELAVSTEALGALQDLTKP